MLRGSAGLEGLGSFGFAATVSHSLLVGPPLRRCAEEARRYLAARAAIDAKPAAMACRICHGMKWPCASSPAAIAAGMAQAATRATSLAQRSIRRWSRRLRPAARHPLARFVAARGVSVRFARSAQPVFPRVLRELEPARKTHGAVALAAAWASRAARQGRRFPASVSAGALRRPGGPDLFPWPNQRWLAARRARAGRLGG